jgi:hypothetical protein
MQRKACMAFTKREQHKEIQAVWPGIQGQLPIVACFRFPQRRRLMVIYNSKLEKIWDDNVGVRRKPRRVLTAEENSDKEKEYFPPKLVPACQHPAVTALGPEAIRSILVRRLYIYLEFSEALELEVVNPVLLKLARNKEGLNLPDEMRFDAHRIYTDEAYHGQFAADLERQVRDMTGITPISVDTPHFLRRLIQLEATVPSKLRGLARLGSAIVAEILISAILSDIPTDKGVVKTVREVVADHAEDEGRHHIYFANLLDFIWPQLTPKQRLTIGPLLPHFIRAFLDPDRSAIEAMLQASGLGSKEIAVVVEECYPEAAATTAPRSRKGTTPLHPQWDSRRPADTGGIPGSRTSGLVQ